MGTVIISMSTFNSHFAFAFLGANVTSPSGSSVEICDNHIDDDGDNLVDLDDPDCSSR
jgi:hypothetical protein